MLPRFSTTCLRSVATRNIWQMKPKSVTVFRHLHTNNHKTFWTQNNQLTKRIFTTSRTLLNANKETITKEIVTKTKPVPEAVAAQTNSQRNATDWAIIKQMMKYIWPKNDIGVKTRVVIALSLLVGGKVSTCWNLSSIKIHY